MLRLRRTEIALFLLVTAIVAWLGIEFGYGGYLQPILERSRKLRAQFGKIREQKKWVRSLKARIAQVELKLKTLAPLLDELQTYTVRDEGDRFRMTVARDQAARGLNDFTLSPLEAGGPPIRLSFRNPVDPNEQLARLKLTFSKENPRATFAKWAVPNSIEVLRYTERFTIESSFKELVRFLGRIEGESPLLEVTDLKVSGAKDEPGAEERVSATIELSAVCLPLEDAGADGQN